MEKRITILNNTLINFFKGDVPNPDAPSSSTMFEGCHICKGEDHLAITCPRLNEPWPKCAKCGMFHRIKLWDKMFFLFKVRSFEGHLLEET